MHALPEGRLHIRLEGSAGQSLGAGLLNRVVRKRRSSASSPASALESIGERGSASSTSEAAPSSDTGDRLTGYSDASAARHTSFVGSEPHTPAGKKSIFSRTTSRSIAPSDASIGRRGSITLNEPMTPRSTDSAAKAGRSNRAPSLAQQPSLTRTHSLFSGEL